MKYFAVRLITYLAAGLALSVTFLLLVLNNILPDYGIIIFAVGIILTYISFWVIEAFLFYFPLRKVISAQKKLSAGSPNARLEIATYDTRLSRLVKSYNDTAIELENLEEVRKSFLSNASHELRSPITSIQGFLQAIIDGTIEQDDYMHYIKIVHDETKRLSDVINSMLNLSRLESGNFPVSSVIFDVNELIRSVCVKFQRKIYNKNMSLENDFKIDPCYVYADKEKIEQVLINLIENAINYSPENTQLNVISAAHIKKAYITVEDHGYGIDPNDQQHIFDRFYTVDKARTPTKTKGTGLGLAIVKKIIQDHNEIIWVESEIKKGTRFTFTLMLFDPALHLGKAEEAQRNGQKYLPPPMAKEGQNK